MRNVRGEGAWRYQGQEVWCQGGEAGKAEKGVRSEVNVGRLGSWGRWRVAWRFQEEQRLESGRMRVRE